MPREICDPVLLTGAGFTHNFGGYLASVMWAHIFNSQEIQSRPRLANLLRQDAELNYESAYNSVLHGDFPQDEKDAFTRTLCAVYAQPDSVLCREGGRQHPEITSVGRFIDPFAGEGNSRGYFFTLNQDLFVERFLRGHQSLMTPGVPQLRFPDSRRCLAEEDLRALPDAAQMGRVRQEDGLPVASSGRFHYIELHGSCNWRPHDGRNAMVIGGNKPQQIAEHPLLEWYFDVFRRVLSLRNRRLLVIGYGFGDVHVNRVIQDAIERGLKLYVLSPGDPGQFRNRLHSPRLPDGERLWDGLAGYFPYTLRDLFPVGEGAETEPARQVRRVTFG